MQVESFELSCEIHKTKTVYKAKVNLRTSED